MSFILAESKSPGSTAQGRGHAALVQELGGAGGNQGWRCQQDVVPPGQSPPADPFSGTMATFPPPCSAVHSVPRVSLPCPLCGRVVVPAHLYSAPTPAGLRLFATKTCAVVLYKQVAKLELDCSGKYWVRPPLSNVCPTIINIDFVQLKYSYTI